jgi:DNA (cytosine-5)-methyltransferase 1
MFQLDSVELCAGGGGQALGLEQAGFNHICLVETDPHCIETLKLNRSHWNVIQDDIAHPKKWKPEDYKGVELLAAGLPCPPFSIAGKQLGDQDERNLFKPAVRIIDTIRPKAVMIENVRGILDAVFDDFRNRFQKQVEAMGYKADWRLLNACDFGVPQLRPRVVFVAIKKALWSNFSWPEGTQKAPTVGEELYDLMASRGWSLADEWKAKANEIAPTLVGGSHKHGGPDLGPTRKKEPGPHWV